MIVKNFSIGKLKKSSENKYFKVGNLNRNANHLCNIKTIEFCEFFNDGDSYN